MEKSKCILLSGRTEAEEEMIKMISSSYDISDKKFIEPIVSLVR